MNSLTILRWSPALFKHPRDEAAAARAGNRNRRDTDPDRGASIEAGRDRRRRVARSRACECSGRHDDGLGRSVSARIPIRHVHAPLFVRRRLQGEARGGCGIRRCARLRTRGTAHSCFRHGDFGGLQHRTIRDRPLSDAGRTAHARPTDRRRREASGFPARHSPNRSIAGPRRSRRIAPTAAMRSGTPAQGAPDPRPGQAPRRRS